MEKFCRLELSTLRAIVMEILPRATSFKWSIQGLGMMRLYIGGVGRIHIWDRELVVPLVTERHTHSWDLRSLVISGEILNTRYLELSGWRQSHGEPCWRRRLRCGYDTEVKGPPESVFLMTNDLERYRPGDCYAQRKHEIHRTHFSGDGAITIMERQADGPDGEAYVYGTAGTAWVDAQPRPATPAEVDYIATRALVRMERERQP